MDAVERGKMVSNICQKLLEKEWRAYDVENIPRGIEGIYCIGVVSGAPRQFYLGEPTVLYVGRTNDVHRRLVEHKHQHLKIDLFVKEEFEDNGGEHLRIKWIKEKNQETKEKDYIECTAHKLGYWPKYNMRRWKRSIDVYIGFIWSV